MQPSASSAIELTAALRKRRLSAVELLDQTIARCETIGAELNPFAVKLYERAQAHARRADQQLKRGAGGALCGLPVTVKDSQWLAGIPCANGSRALADFVPQQTCTAIERLEAAGAVVFAKTTCPEFGLVGITDSTLYGRTANPWDPARTPGGSSGGAAVAVATGLGALSLGGDGGGSIRIPAAFCGIVGFKPSFDLVPREPCFPSWRSLVSYGPMTRSVADARLMLSVMRRCNGMAPQPDAEINSLAGLTLVVSRDFGFVPLDDDVRARFDSVLAMLESAGAELLFDTPQLPSSVQTWAITATYDSWRHQVETPHDGEMLEETTRAILAFGSQFPEADFLAAQAQRGSIRQAYAAMFERTAAVALLTPTLGCEAFPHGRVHPERIGDTPIELPWLDWAGFLYDANLAGMPACALPMGLGDDGLPVSLQVMAPPGRDMRVLDVAEQIESLIGWQHPHTD